MKCEECGKMKSVIQFSTEPLLALTHGFNVDNICRQCYIKRIEKGLKEIKENLKKQKALLKKDNKTNRNI